MAIIVLPSDVTQYQSGGHYDCSTTAACNANFPALKHWYPCTESAGALSITDRAGGNDLSNSSAASVVSNSASGLITVGAVDTRSGSWTVPGTKVVVVLAVGSPTAAGVLLAMGKTEATANADAGNGFIRHGCGSAPTTEGRSGIDGVASVDVPSASLLAANSTLMGWGAYYDWGGNTCAFYANNSDTVTAETPAAMTGMSAGLSAFEDQTTQASISANMVVGSIQVFHFTTLPSLPVLQGALSFMRNMLSQDGDYKFVYPGFYGLS